MGAFLSFFRFTIPGLLSPVLLMVAYFIYDPYHFPELISNLKTYPSHIFSGVILSAVLGYIFSMIYRAIFPVHGLDHIELVDKLLKDGKITVQLIDEKYLHQVRGTHPQRKRIAYEIINIVWHLNHESFDKSKTEFHANILNSQGSSSISSIFSFIAFISSLIFIFPDCSCQTNLGFALLFYIAVTSFLFYMRNSARQSYQNWINSTIASVLYHKKTSELVRNIKCFSA
ncbi:MAG: hypothetical protein JKY52_04165 [Flavobacteriales bacterium]|nr:hypothetical protein [Flavobacteriales bacterium]